ncbi:hypothetical protein F8388_017532 [Cannabis sativa]|uniref:RNase H type-1 domain-containing protein n=1 Tax=Cannabis sativa TaxID=3483 RepID=A0A7J6G2N5_CANSA|nr:hypothetical protein F8388_017532 [Cannabis sativa]
MDSSMIRVKVTNILHGKAWFGVFVYAPPSRGDRKEFWEHLALEVAAFQTPWILLGDLNCISGQFDKYGGRSVCPQETRLLTEFMEITRAIVDPNWILMYPKAGVKALTIKDSDHAPLVLDFLLEQDRYNKPFRFLDAWIRDPECFEVVKDAWKLVVSGAKSLQLLSRSRIQGNASLYGINNTLGSAKRSFDFWTSFYLKNSEPSILPWSLNWVGSWLQILLDLGVKCFLQSMVLIILLFGIFLYPENATSLAKGIMGCRDFIRKESCWIVGNGSLIDLWSAPWIPWLDWDSYCPAFNPRCQVLKVSILSELLDDSGNFDLDVAARWFNPTLICRLREVIPLDRELFIQVAVSLCNTLWNARNSCFHEGTVVSPEVILCKTLSDVQEWRVARSKLPPVVVGSTPNSIVPRNASVRVFSDANVRGSVAYTAFLVLDSKDQILGVATYKFQVNSPLEAEAYGLISAVEFCQSSGWNEVRFYTDCQILVKALEDRSCPSWRLMPLFSKLFFLLCCGSGVNVTWVLRNFNLPAHELAKWIASLGICQSLSAEEIILVLGCLNVVV